MSGNPSTEECPKYTVNVVGTVNEATNVVQEHENSTSQKYVVWTQTKNFGQAGLYDKNHKIMWEDDVIEYCGIPFMVLSTKTFDCQYGKDRNLSTKMKRLSVDSSHPYKNPNQLRLTKKCGCSAKLIIKEIASFPDYNISGNTKWKRGDASKRLRTSVKDRSIIDFHRHFVVITPRQDLHSNHPGDEPLEHESLGQINEGEEKNKKGKTQTKAPILKAPIQLAPACIELLAEIKILTRMVEGDDTVIRDLHKNLDAIKHCLSNCLRQRGFHNLDLLNMKLSELSGKIPNEDNVTTVEASVVSTPKIPLHNVEVQNKQNKKRKSQQSTQQNSDNCKSNDKKQKIDQKKASSTSKTNRKQSLATGSSKVSTQNQITTPAVNWATQQNVRFTVGQTETNELPIGDQSVFKLLPPLKDHLNYTTNNAFNIAFDSMPKENKNIAQQDFGVLATIMNALNDTSKDIS